MYYSSETLCSKCKNNYFLLDNECHPSIDNCISYTDKDNCSECDSDYKIVSSNDKFICQSINIPNCLLYDKTKENNPCVLCEDEYFPSNGECERISANELIPNCVSYSNKTVCQ